MDDDLNGKDDDEDGVELSREHDVFEWNETDVSKRV